MATLNPPVTSTGRWDEVGSSHRLVATPENCFWGYFDRSLKPALEVGSGDVIEIEAVTHHAGDAPDLLMDDGIRDIWAANREDERGPGVHLMTGPIAVRGAEPGDTLVVEILSMTPRHRHGSNVAAHWGLLHHLIGHERVTIYELEESEDGSDEWASWARPSFAFDFEERSVYDVPGVVTPPGSVERQPCSGRVRVPVRPHFGVMGVAPPTTGRLSSVPPGTFGGNVDNWRFGPGARVAYPVSTSGGMFYVGDPHFAQGDGEICGTAIEASVNAVIRLTLESELAVTAPLLETTDAWTTHGFGPNLDQAMLMAAQQMLWFLSHRLGLDSDEAYSVASVAVDFGVTQVVDGTVGCHATVLKSIVD